MSANKHTNKLKLQNYAYEVSDTGVFTRATSGSNVYFQPFDNSNKPILGHGNYSLIEAMDIDWRPYKINETNLITSYDLVRTIESGINTAAQSLELYLPLVGGTMSGNIVFTSTSSAFTGAGLTFSHSSTQDAHISADTNGGLGLYGRSKIAIRPSFSDNTVGLEITSEDIQYNKNTVWHAGNDGHGSGLDADLLDNRHAKDIVPLVKGTQTTATGAWTGSLVGTGISELYDGLTIKYYLPRAGSGNATLNLTLDDGNNTTTGPINCYISSGRLTTHYAVGTVVIFTYFSAGSISINGTPTTDNRWIAHADYNSDTTYNFYAYHKAKFIHSADTPLYRYKLFGYDKDGKVVPLTITNQTGATIVE